MEYLGLNIVQTPLCETVKVSRVVMRHPIRKRRRNWSIKRVETKVPTIMTSGNTVYMHPSLYAQLRKDTP